MQNKKVFFSAKQYFHYFSMINANWSQKWLWQPINSHDSWITGNRFFHSWTFFVFSELKNKKRNIHSNEFINSNEREKNGVFGDLFSVSDKKRAKKNASKHRIEKKCGRHKMKNLFFTHSNNLDAFKSHRNVNDND